MSQSKLVT